MPIDPSYLPSELIAYADAVDMAPAGPRWGIGWRTSEWPAPTVPLIADAPPYDGVHRGSWVSPGICVRLDLGAIPTRVAAQLRAALPGQLGADGALYQYGIASSSQRRNLEAALLALAHAIGALDLS